MFSSKIPIKTPRRHRHDLSHYVKMTGEMGTLMPILCQDVLPGDRFKVSVTDLIRFAPLIAPVMSEIDVYVHFFFVPNRIIWTQWEDFITGAHNGKMLPDDEIPLPPRYVFEDAVALKQGVSGDILSNRSLADYIGIQTWRKDYEFQSNAQAYSFDALPFRAYQKIFDDYYCDENLQLPTSVEDYVDRGGNIRYSPDGATEVPFMMQMRRRAWRKDYFTSALPFPQKGDDVLIPGSGLSGDIFSPRKSTIFEGTATPHRPSSTTSTAVMDRDVQFSSPAGGSNGKFKYPSVSSGSTISGGADISISTSTRISGSALNSLLADHAQASEGTIRELRRALAAQKFLEKRAIGGSRYIEQNLAFFGVKSSDGRLQRSQFLGGSKNHVVISQVLQTSETTQNSPQGNPSGNAVSAGSRFIFDREFEEYGWIIGIMSIIPKADYMQGLPRKFNRRDLYDYYWPQFAHVGEQEILNQELYWSDYYGGSNKNEQVFGYAPRYSEYRFNNNRVVGDFKDSLKFWTLARDFDQTPALNREFVTCNPSDRIFAVGSDSNFHHLWIECHLDIKTLRPVTKYGYSSI